MDNLFDILDDEDFIIDDSSADDSTEDTLPFGQIEFCQTQCPIYSNNEGDCPYYILET